MPPRGNVLVVDDDDDQLQTLCRGLRCLGLDCLPARSAAEGEALLGGRVELLLADVTRPGAPAARLVERALARRVPVLLIAGLALSPEAQALRAAGVPLLRKPFGPEELGRAIERAVPGNPGARR